MQQDALVSFAELERRADLLGAEALGVAHADHRALGGRQRGDRGDDVERIARVQGLVRQLPPVRGEYLPAPGILVIGTAEAVGVDGRLAVALEASDANGTDRASLTPRVFAVLTTIRRIQVFNEERPSKPSTPRITPIQASWTTSSASERERTCA
jgi:hypothetical protein